MALDTPALIETIRIRQGLAPLLALHRQRLEASCEALGLPSPVDFSVPTGGPDRVMRLVVSPGDITRAERPVGSSAPVRLATSPVVHEPYRHKVVQRMQFDRTLELARQAGADDAVMLTADGFVAETAIWCLFWWEGDRLCAPALDLAILPGVSRARIGQLAGPIVERRASRADLAGRSLFVSNAARGIVPVAILDRSPVPEHPGTARLQEAFWT